MPIRRTRFASLLLLGAGAVACLLISARPGLVLAAGFTGSVLAQEGAPVVGAMVTLSHGDPVHSISVFVHEDGSFATPELRRGVPYALRVRRIGWKDLRLDGLELPPTGVPRPLSLVLDRENDPVALAAQLPANRWYGLLLARVEEAEQREELVRQCTFCHQQGNAATRLRREPWQWEKVLALMNRMGGIVSKELRRELPELLNAAYDPATAVPALTAEKDAPGFAPAPPARVRRAVIEEWELGERAAMQHDLTVHPDGRIYSVDMMQDKLYRLEPESGSMEVFEIPRGDLPLGGVFGGRGQPLPPTANAHVGPHSLQVAPDGALFVTLALGNQIARFDPKRESWSFHALEDGFYPHTLRFDSRGRIWYTIAASNHLGLLDPATGAHRQIRLPAKGFGQAVALRLLPALLWLNRRFDLSGLAANSDPMVFPVPYGIDVAPDGSVWFSQLNQHRIGRIDPDTLDVALFETPFTGPRRLRFDSAGNLWIPGFSSGLIARYDPRTGKFDTYDLPIEPPGSETPYALHVDHRNDTVWVCGTNSDSLIRFETDRERFTVYPLPTRVTYTREIDFDEAGRIWTSNSNLPTWQIEGGFPRVLRLDPGEEKPAVGQRTGTPAG